MAMSGQHGRKVVLASASEARARLLRNAGVPFSTVPADLDETTLLSEARAAGRPPAQAALLLAEAKALSVATRYPDALVIGADQLMVSGERWLEKPGSIAVAREMLRSLRGRRHQLLSGVVVVVAGVARWRHVDVAEMSMRQFSDAFLDRYLEEAGTSIVSVVGACRLEGVGAQLLDDVAGDFFTVLGLPLLPLLGCLREHGVLPD